MGKTARHLLGCLTLCASLAFCADPQQAPETPRPAPKVVKKLRSFTYDMKSHKLLWVVQTGSVVDGKFVSSSEQEYEVAPDEAVMTVSAERRGFSNAEAASLQNLLDVLTMYCAESVVWWDQGEGRPLDGKTPPKRTSPTTPERKPVKVRDQAPVRTVPVNVARR